MIKKRQTKNSVKEAIDNLPIGVCFFDSRGMLSLCSRQMYRLVFLMADMELQNREDLDFILQSPPQKCGVEKIGDLYLFRDGSVWTFRQNNLTDSFGDDYAEYLAFDVSELYSRGKALELQNGQLREDTERLGKIYQNLVSITREEEILTLKMQIHQSLGFTLQSARSFLTGGCPAGDKQAFIAEQRRMAKVLLGEVGNDDEINVYKELERIAERLGIKLVTEGALPEDEQTLALLATAARECMTNTIRHANGDTVYVETSVTPLSVTAVITNNGEPPKGKITEGGGLSTLRSRVERMGGEMKTEHSPNFVLTIKLPRKEDM